MMGKMQNSERYVLSGPECRTDLVLGFMLRFRVNTD